MAEELTAKEAERRYNVSGSWLIRKHKEGLIEARMIGPIYLFKPESIEAWLKVRKTRGKARKPKESTNE